ncbi:MAG: hypothetical protein ACPLSP_07045, partial [Fervidicoccus fontis]
FTDFKAEASRTLQLRGADDYLKYAREGGRLIILNTNGYGYFASRTLNLSEEAINVTMITGLQTLQLPIALSVSKLSVKSQDSDVLGYYLSQQDSSIYAFREKIGSGEIIYVNVYPIINAIQNAAEKSQFYYILGGLLKPVGIALEPFKYTPPSLSATFNYVEASGKITANSSSIIFPLDINLRKVVFTDWMGEKTEAFNVTKIALADYSHIQVDASNMTIGNGRGFYSTLKVKGGADIKIEGKAYAEASTLDGNIIRLSNVKEVKIGDDEPITLYLREPAVAIDGSIFLKEFYSSGSLYQKTRTYGQDLKVNGTIQMTIYMSDAYTWIRLCIL